jgi:N-methylhydantoinase B
MAHGDTRIIPLELQEATLPIRIEEFALRQDSAGPGTFRGGLGFRKVYRILAPCMVQTNLDRTKFPPWGVHGGGQAKRGRFTLLRCNGERKSVGKEKGLALAPGDLLGVETGGGGGYGKPEARPVAAIQHDLDAGYISPVGAERDYGVTIGADGKARR